MLALLVHQDLAVDSLDEVVAPDFSEVALGEIDDQLQLVASYCRCFDVQTSEKLEETIELRVVEQRRASGEVLVGETCDIVGQSGEKLLVFEGNDCSAEETDHFAESREEDAASW